MSRGWTKDKRVWYMPELPDIRYLQLDGVTHENSAYDFTKYPENNKKNFYFGTTEKLLRDNEERKSREVERTAVNADIIPFPPGRRDRCGTATAEIVPFPKKIQI